MANEKRLKTCGDCIHADICKQVNSGWFSPENIAYCKGFKDSANFVEVVRGYWIERPLDNFRKYEVKCSECGFIGIGDYDQYLEPIDFYFCPRCGTRMDRLDGDGNA